MTSELRKSRRAREPKNCARGDINVFQEEKVPDFLSVIRRSIDCALPITFAANIDALNAPSSEVNHATWAYTIHRVLSCYVSKFTKKRVLQEFDDNVETFFCFLALL